MTETLLKLHFGLSIQLPGNRLCPPVPNRHNYILFLKKLLDSTTYHHEPATIPRRGIDIGTGASAIYPLLGHAQRASWTFVATESDEESLSFARRNVEANGFGDAITVLGPMGLNGPLIPLGKKMSHEEESAAVAEFDFLMTNPPFYSSEQELISLGEKKARPPNSACTGVPTEMVCPGGEVGFVSRIFKESLVHGSTIRWYTSMLGKLESLDALVQMFHEHNVDNYAIGELVQGKRTKRWVVAWSFNAMRPSQDVCGGVRAVGGKKVAPAKVEEEVLSVREEAGHKVFSSFKEDILQVMMDMDLIFWEEIRKHRRDWEKVVFGVIGRATENVWSRSWRRKKMRGEAHVEKVKEMPSDGTCAFGFAVAIYDADGMLTVVVKWREGHDAIMYESFCGFMKRKLIETRQ